MTHMNDDSIATPINAHYLSKNEGGGKTQTSHQTCEPMRIAPHPRTLRKACEQFKYRGSDGFSARRIRNYLHRWGMWWTKTSGAWQYRELLQHFIDVCKHEIAAAFATALSSLPFTELDIQSVDALVVTA